MIFEYFSYTVLFVLKFLEQIKRDIKSCLARDPLILCNSSTLDTHLEMILIHKV